MAYVQVILYVDDDLAAWFDEKARQGYKKASLIRKILDDYCKAEAVRNVENNESREAGVKAYSEALSFFIDEP
jgi:hypothetical protein